MDPLTHFEIQVDDIERASNFYRAVFGWEIGKWSGGGMEYVTIMTTKKEGGGINGGMLKRSAKTPPQECGTNSYVCTMLVEDFEATAKKVIENGGKVAMPKFAIPKMAWQGYFLDTEGNTFGVHQPDTNAE